MDMNSGGVTKQHRINLMPEELKKRMPVLYSQENVADPLVRVKFFTPWAEWTWYGIEFDGEDAFFGLVDGFERELGYFSLSELENLEGPSGLRVERDLYFEPTPLSTIYPSFFKN